MKVGILGAGGIAKKMAYTLLKMEDASCYAIASRSLEKAKQFAKEEGVLKAYGSYEELIKDPEVELIYIATPHSHHYEQVMCCLEHNKPVLCEKAFMANAIQAKEVLELARKKKVFITEAIWTRYMPSRKMIDDLIKADTIGEIVSVTANLGYTIKDVERVQKPELAGGALLDIGIYPISFASMFLGNDIKEVISTCVKMESGVDAQNVIILKYADDKLATLHSGVYAATEQQGIIYGTKGYIIAENINNIDQIKVYSSDRKLLQTLQVPEQITGFEDEVRACIKAIRAGEIECPEIPHEEILLIMKLMDQLRSEWGVKYPFE